MNDIVDESVNRLNIVVMRMMIIMFIFFTVCDCFHDDNDNICTFDLILKQQVNKQNYGRMSNVIFVCLLKGLGKRTIVLLCLYFLESCTIL